jgi:hypothetical protein
MPIELARNITTPDSLQVSPSYASRKAPPILQTVAAAA